jgi:hypothetical protein
MKTRRKRAERGRRERLETSLELVRPDGTRIRLGSLTDQVYSFQTEDGWQRHWSVNEARKRAEANAEPMTISLAETGMTADIARRLYPGLDETYAVTTDLTKPLLFVPLDGECVLIDGWHRTFKALLTGVDVLPCYVLSQEDADASQILILPPGKGLSDDIFGAEAGGSV